MRFVDTGLDGVVFVEPDVHRDARGLFLETYHEERYRRAGIAERFVQDNHSRSVRGTVRGLHAQIEHPQGKLVRALAGEILDVAVDARRGSPTFGRWVGVLLSSENFRQLYVPPGYLHGFSVLSETAELAYKCTDFYHRDDELTVAWNDPEIGIDWRVEEPVLSDRDRKAPRLAEVLDRLPVYEPARR